MFSSHTTADEYGGRFNHLYGARSELNTSPRPPIVFACANFPWPLHQGVKLRLYHIIQALVTVYDVHLVVMTDSGRDLIDESGLAEVCSSITLVPMSSAQFRLDDASPFWNSRMAARLRQLFLDRLPSMVRGFQSTDLSRALSALHTDFGDIPFWSDLPAFAELAVRVGFSRVLVDYDDIESEQASRSLKPLAWWRPGRVLVMIDVIKLRRYERTMAQRFSAIVIARPKDVRYFGRDTSRVLLVPNGIALSATLGPQSNDCTLLFVGSFGWGPNSEAVEWMVDFVMPLILAQRPGVRLVAVGQRGSIDWATRMRARGVELFESVDSLVPFYTDATVVVAPLRRGSGTKIKVLEAMMAGRPIVATEVAMEGIQANHDDAVLIANSAADFATATLQLLENSSLRNHIGNRARNIAKSLYAWETIRPAILSAAGAISSSAERKPQ